MRFRSLFVLILLVATGLSVLAEGYEINFSLPSFRGDTLVLGHRFNASFIPKDTVVADGKGRGTFTGNESLPEGMYLVFLPDQSFFDLLIGPDQSFDFETDTSDYIANMKIMGSVDNEAFYAYQLFLKVFYMFHIFSLYLLYFDQMCTNLSILVCHLKVLRLVY